MQNSQKQKVKLEKMIKYNIKKEQEQGSIWNTLINGIVRPPRANYNQAQLGRQKFSLNQINYTRIDQTIPHKDKYHLFVTIFQPEYKTSFNPIIVYLHGNSSSKLESLTILKQLPIGFSLACFDFIGCGLNRQSQMISLGYRQSDQVQTVTNYLKSGGYQVILWGRSMGAASALRFGKALIIVADSSFKSLKSLCKQVVKSNKPKFVPGCLIQCFFPLMFYKLKKDVEEKGQYDMSDIDIKEAVKNINNQSVLIFLSGDQDLLIHHSNSEKLYETFKGTKYLQIFKGNHNSKRPSEVLKKVMEIVKVEFYKKKYSNMNKNSTNSDFQVNTY